MICVWLNNHKLKTEENKEEKGTLKMGGAEGTLGFLVEEGKKRGNDVQIMTPFDFDMEKIKKADLIVFSNIIYGKRPNEFKHSDLDWIVDNKEFIVLNHDSNFCRFRNPQCLEQCQLFHCQPHWFRKMFTKAKLAIFLSPLQVKIHLRFFWKELGSKKYIDMNAAQIKKAEEINHWADNWKDMVNDKVVVIPPTVKKSQFKPSPSAVIEGNYCVVGAIYSGKGIEDILMQYSELKDKLRFIGNTNDPRLGAMISNAGHTIVPSVSHSEMPNILQKYNKAIISRRIPKRARDGSIIINNKEQIQYAYLYEGFGRIVMEYHNTGITILVDKKSRENIGAYSFGISLDHLSDLCDKADILFFDTLKEKGIIG